MNLTHLELPVPEEEEEASECQNREQEVGESADIAASALRLCDRDINAILSKNVDKIRVVREGDGSASTIDCGQLHGS